MQFCVVFSSALFPRYFYRFKILLMCYGNVGIHFLNQSLNVSPNVESREVNADNLNGI